MFRKIRNRLQYWRASPLEKMAADLRAEDPDFGKVSNDEPGIEFAFELRGHLNVPSILELSSIGQEFRIEAVDDFGKPVIRIPLDDTSRAFFFDLAGQSIEVKTEEEVLPVSDVLQILSRGMVECIESLNTSQKEKRKLCASRFSRFYYRSPGSWWTFTYS